MEAYMETRIKISKAHTSVSDNHLEYFFSVLQYWEQYATQHQEAITSAQKPSLNVNVKSIKRHIHDTLIIYKQYVEDQLEEAGLLSPN